MASAKQKYLFDIPSSSKIAEAARSIILSVKRDHVVTNAQIGALFDASADTVQRLEDMETKKVPARSEERRVGKECRL